MTLTDCCATTVLKTTLINCNIGGERLDVFLAANIPGLTRSGAQKLIEQGRVALGDSGVIVQKSSHKTAVGEVFAVSQDEPVESDAIAQDIPLEVVFEDDDVIVVNKPRGMVVHPAPGHPDGTLVNALLNHCGDSLSGIGGEKRPGIVHRIDKDTSGLIIAAKNDFAHVNLSAQLAARTLIREYEAIACGVMKNDSGTINAPIGRHPTDRKRQSAASKTPREAVTHYEVVERFDKYTHVRCRLETGRTHQIRVHMAHTGYPILGDPVYGRKNTGIKFSGQCLHAKRLSFVHPRSGEVIDLQSDLPEYFTELLRKLG